MSFLIASKTAIRNRRPANKRRCGTHWLRWTVYAGLRSDKMAISQRPVDPYREFKVSVRYSWQESYHAALLETDWTKMVELVQKAESDIHKRRLQLTQDHNGTQEEREAVVNALNGLRVLRMDAAAWRERQNLVGTPQPNTASTLGTPR